VPQKGMGVQVPPRTPNRGNFPHSRHCSNTRSSLPLGRPAPLPWGGGHDCPAHCSSYPPRARPGAWEHGRAAPARRLPVAAAPQVPAVPDDVVYEFGRMDESGRVGDRAITGVLGWQSGDRLPLATLTGEPHPLTTTEGW
jgi:hypothetical protein